MITGFVLLISITSLLLFVLENQQLVVVSLFGFSSLQLQISLFGVALFLMWMIFAGAVVVAHFLGRRRGR
ncbi:hypothetical protein [Pseudomonas sp. MWU13-2100]|uniref:hypothetical protein n=1 Tax=Pseudomonas sp. MWU13-2100 TaxID=2935075 RepID=UPI00200DBFF5|nr:hypothetical protein [Pseudomonas sp. MWU13-2100]